MNLGWESQDNSLSLLSVYPDPAILTWWLSLLPEIVALTSSCCSHFINLTLPDTCSLLCSVGWYHAVIMLLIHGLMFSRLKHGFPVVAVIWEIKSRKTLTVCFCLLGNMVWVWVERISFCECGVFHWGYYSAQILLTDWWYKIWILEWDDLNGARVSTLAPFLSLGSGNCFHCMIEGQWASIIEHKLLSQ